MVETRRGGVLGLVVVALLMVGALAPATAVGPPRGGCVWAASLLPLPDNAFDGLVTAGDGAWFAGVADGMDGVRWHDGRVERLGQAFGLDTTLNGINASGEAVGSVTGTDHRRHAVRYAGGEYEYLPESAGGSVAVDVNARGEIAGFAGAALVVWPSDGPARVLAMPPGATAFGRPAIDDDGTVVARTGQLDGDAMRWQGYVWKPAGTRLPLATGDVQDIRHGQMVGASTPSAGSAMGWALDGGRPRLYPDGVTAVAVNNAGLVVGAGPAGEPLLWDGFVPTALPAPPGYYPGSVTALNDRAAGGFVSSNDNYGIVPVQWRCR
jgi:hypothetical protein